jgi:hypothetical protein
MGKSSTKSGKKSDSGKGKEKGKTSSPVRHSSGGGSGGDKHRSKDRRKSDHAGSKGRDNDPRLYSCMCICGCVKSTSSSHAQCADCVAGIHKM